jgi:uncharacterized membrane protein
VVNTLIEAGKVIRDIRQILTPHNEATNRMELRMLFLLIALGVQICYVVGTTAAIRTDPGKGCARFVVASVVSMSIPLMIAILILIFACNASPVVQGNVGSESAMRMWSFWVRSIGNLICVTMFWTVNHIIACACVWPDAESRRYRILFLIGIATSVSALLALGEFAPRA